MRLYEIRQDIEQILNPQEGEDFNPEILDELRLRFEEKVENCIAYIKNLKSDEEALDKEIKRLQARKQAAENKRRGLSDYVKAEIEAVGRQGVDTGVHRARIARSPISVEVIDTNAIEDGYKETVTEERIDKEAILAHFRETGEIPSGVEIRAGTHLRIS